MNKDYLAEYKKSLNNEFIKARKECKEIFDTMITDKQKFQFEIKYKLKRTNNIIGRRAYRVYYTDEFIDAYKEKTGITINSKGGFVSSQNNLPQDDFSVILDCAFVTDNAIVSDNAIVCNSAIVSDGATITKNAKIQNKARVINNAVITDNAIVKDNAIVGNYIKITGNAIIDGYNKLVLKKTF